MTPILSLADVRPGDIYLGPIGGGLGAAIRAAQVIVDGGWRVGPLHVEHIGIVVEAAWDGGHDGVAPRMVQAMPHGAEEIELTLGRHWTPRCAYARIPEDYPGQAADAAAIARLMVGTPYSFGSYAALAAYHWGFRAPRLTDWIGRRDLPPLIVKLPSNKGKLWTTTDPDALLTQVALPREAICSVLADQAWSLAGKRVMEGTAPQAVTPSQLGQRLLTGMDGVVWGWPRPAGRDFLLGPDS